MSRAVHQPEHRHRFRRAFAGIAAVTTRAVLLTHSATYGRSSAQRADTPACDNPDCDTSAITAPFAPAGWETVARDHFALQAADAKREADVGTVGSIVIRSGFQALPPLPTPTAADSAAGRARGPRAVAWDFFARIIEP